MCMPAICGNCKKATYSGCGMHVDELLAGFRRSSAACATANDVSLDVHLGAVGTMT
jgi:hypothetical protein